MARRVASEREVMDPTFCVCCGYQVEREDLRYDCDPLELKFLYLHISYLGVQGFRYSTCSLSIASSYSSNSGFLRECSV